MKTFSIYLIALVALLGTRTYAQSTSGWTYLFDGKLTDALRGYKMTGFPSSAWAVEDGALVAQTGVPNIDLVTKQPYKNFELTFDWKVSKAGNSGIFYYVVEDAVSESGNGNSPNWLDNFEMQLLDDIDFNDKAPIRSAGSLYDLIIPTNKQLKPVGEYNTARLIVNNNHVEHWLNGRNVVTYDIGSPDLNRRIEASKYKDNPKFGKSTNGLIMIQHHGQKVWFKNVRVRSL